MKDNKTLNEEQWLNSNGLYNTDFPHNELNQCIKHGDHPLTDVGRQMHQMHIIGSIDRGSVVSVSLINPMMGIKDL